MDDPATVALVLSWLPRKELSIMSTAGRAYRRAVYDCSEMLVVCGGRGSHGHVSDCFGLVDGARWVRLASMPEPRAHAAAGALADNKLLVHGGELQNGQRVSSTLYYDAIVDAWTPLHHTYQNPEGWEVPMQSDAGYVTLFRELDSTYFYIVGGLGNTDPTQHVLSFASSKASLMRTPFIPHTAHHECPLPSARFSCACAQLDRDRFYAIGGYEAGRAVRQVLCYEIYNYRWFNTERNLPEPRFDGAAATLGGKIYYVGGRDDNFRPRAEVYVYDPHVEQWTSGPPLPEPRGSCRAVVHRGELVVVGGTVTTPPRSAPIALRGGAWTPLPPLPWDGESLLLPAVATMRVRR